MNETTFTITITESETGITFEVTTPFETSEDNARYLKRTTRMSFDGKTATSGKVRATRAMLATVMSNTIANMRDELRQTSDLLAYRDEVRAFANY